ncbi:serine/threonine-protein kinase [Polyangium aurulentum]|uniref:serine/threonine-protein kinase n=1 Tax=Polyangium aurulentum TaxID=2567896 RepID=UPI0010AEE161|nr:serine/threonine-protein kinase [Polyangium aurulentum]UQA62911.1 protein kinase [Polyangium aurulentum]
MLPARDIGALVAERFAIENAGHSGGMGTVYRARDAETGRVVALKLLDPTGDPDELVRFAREATLLSRLQHPGIVAYVAHGVTPEGQPYLVMEWLEGEDLQARLAREALDLHESLLLLRRVAEALAVAHARGVVHRDLKPSNLFLRDGLVERTTVLDFGLARAHVRSHELTRSGIVLGTPGYMAPEQVRGERTISPAADVFALGCVIFECLTGRTVYAGDHVLAVLAKILFDEPPRLRLLRPEMPEAVDDLIARMLARDPAVRLPDAAAVLAALGGLDEVSLSQSASISAPQRLSWGGVEQEFVCVLLATPGETRCTGEGSTALASTDISGLRTAITEHGAEAAVLLDGSIVATFGRERGAATDQAGLAARCALSMQSRSPGMKIALATGRKLAGGGLPVGDALDRAGRLLRQAAEDPECPAIVLDDVTAGLLGVRFQARKTPAGALVLVGEERALDESRPLLGKPTPCVGRESEIALLEGTLRECVEDAAPRGVLVVAEPGVGKSRLLHEFLRRAAPRERGILLLLGRGDPMRASATCGVLGGALRRHSGIAGDDGMAERRDKLARCIGERIPEDRRQRVVEFVGEVCGVPFPDEDSVKLRAAREDPRLMSDQITEAFLDYLRAETAERPVLIVLDDLHWGDALTVRLVDAALRSLEDRPLMVLALGRPEVLETFPDLRRFEHLLSLRPLVRRACERLAREVLGAPASPDAIARIVDRSGGNALFLEELIRGAAEGRGDEAPPTVLAMLQARIARLDPAARRLLRVASIFGEELTLSGLRALLDEGVEGLLERLVEDELFDVRRGEDAQRGDKVYRFRHALMRDAARALLTEEEAAGCHRAVGEWLAARPGTDAVVLAEHFLRGNDPARAAHLFGQAAEQAFEAADMDAALACAERGLSCGAEGEDRGVLASIAAGVHFWREQHAEVVARCSEALPLLPEGSLRWCRAFKHLLPAIAMTQPQALVQTADRFVRAKLSSDARSEYVQAATWASVMLSVIGMKPLFVAVLARVRRVQASTGERKGLGWASLRAAEANGDHVVLEAPWSCVRGQEESRQAFEDAGDRRSALIAGAYHGKALQDIGDLAAAESVLRDNLALAEGVNDAMPVIYAKTYLARLLAEAAPIERLDEPRRLALDVVASKNLSLLGVAQGALARIALRSGDVKAAEAEAGKAIEAVQLFPAYAWEIVALWGQIQRELGRGEEALRATDEAVEKLERLELHGVGEISLRVERIEAFLSLGRTDEARRAIAEALAALRLRQDDIPDAAARALYLASVPANARLVELAGAWLGVTVKP